MVAWVTTAFAQNTNPRLSQLDEYLQKQKENVNIDSIRNTFSILSKEASDSYRYEYHRDGADTIKYELVFRADDSDHQGPIQEFARFFSKGTQAEYHHGQNSIDLTVSKPTASTSTEQPNPRLKQLASPSSVTTRPSSSELGRLSLLRQLEDCLRKQGYEIGYSQWNRASQGITRNWTIGFGARGQEIINNMIYHIPDSLVALRRQQLAIAIDSIRAAFTDLSKEGVESHQYEKHDGCADTIDYSIGFFDGKKDLMARTNITGNHVFFHNAKEQASFSYHKNCDDWDVGNYWHRYESDNRVTLKSFDAEAFKAHIQPAFAVLKSLKGAATYPVYWRHDAEYKDSLSGGRISMILGKRDRTGLVTGNHYFIPSQYKGETNALYQQLDSLTFDYVNRHPEQNHHYYTDSALPYATDPTGELKTITAASINSLQRIPIIKLQGHSYGLYSEDDDYYFFFYMKEDGLHILSITSKGEGWMPKEWQKLKSWINGKREYLKGAEQDAKRQAVVDAITAKKWRIDVHSMNTMRYGSRTVSPDFYLELRGDKLHSYLPYLGQAQVSPTLSPSIGLNFEEPVLSYKTSKPKSKKYTQIDIDVKTREDKYHYVVQLYDSGDATIRVRSLNRDPISFEGTMVTSK